MTTKSPAMVDLAQQSPKPINISADDLKHAPGVSTLTKDAVKHVPNVEALQILVSSSDTVQRVSGFLHTPHGYRDEHTDSKLKIAAILLSGAGGGVVGPSSIYLSIADKLAALDDGIPVMRLDYRYPARSRYCVPDVLAAMEYLQNELAVSRFVLVGWSYGGAPVFTVGGQDERVVGSAAIASQTAETDGIRQLARKNVPTLLIHGTADQRLGASCSESLYERYRKVDKDGPCELQFLNGDDHFLTKNPLTAEDLLCRFIIKQANVEIKESERSSVLQRPLLDDGQRKETMEKAGDLEGERNS
jgi:alpha/beta superfamily hydrolase